MSVAISNQVELNIRKLFFVGYSCMVIYTTLISLALGFGKLVLIIVDPLNKIVMLF